MLTESKRMGCEDEYVMILHCLFHLYFAVTDLLVDFNWKCFIRVLNLCIDWLHRLPSLFLSFHLFCFSVSSSAGWKCFVLPLSPSLPAAASAAYRHPATLAPGHQPMAGSSDFFLSFFICFIMDKFPLCWVFFSLLSSSSSLIHYYLIL